MAAAVVLLGALCALAPPRGVDAAAGDGSSALSLPFATGQTWTLLGGPHDWNGSADSAPSSEWNSLDLTCAGISASCDGVVLAARAGVVHFDSCGPGSNYVRVDHLDGWSTSFYHLLNVQVSEGQTVARGQPLGNIGQGVGCGGSAASPHTHFSVWYTTGGFSLSSDAAEDPEQRGLDGVDVGGWTIHAGGAQYGGCLVRDSDGNTQCSGSGQIRNDGAIGASGGGSAVVGVVGTDNSLFSKQDAQDYQWLGGNLLGAPAVVSVSSSSGSRLPLFIGVGTDHRLYVRSVSASWQDLINGSDGCWDNPAATVTGDGRGGSILTVACKGGDTSLYYWQAPVSSSALPLVTTPFTLLSGELAAGPAVAALNGTLTFYAVASANHFVYSRTATTPYVQTAAQCNGHPAVASGGAVAYMACQGLDGALYYSANSGSGWSPFRSAGGRLIDGPGIALTVAGAVVYVEGTDTAVYQTLIDASTDAASNFAYDGGRVQYGTGATALR